MVRTSILRLREYVANIRVHPWDQPTPALRLYDALPLRRTGRLEELVVRCFSETPAPRSPLDAVRAELRAAYRIIERGVGGDFPRALDSVAATLGAHLEVGSCALAPQDYSTAASLLSGLGAVRCLYDLRETPLNEWMHLCSDFIAHTETTRNDLSGIERFRIDRTLTDTWIAGAHLIVPERTASVAERRVAGVATRVGLLLTLGELCMRGAKLPNLPATYNLLYGMQIAEFQPGAWYVGDSDLAALALAEAWEPSPMRSIQIMLCALYKQQLQTANVYLRLAQSHYPSVDWTVWQEAMDEHKRRGFASLRTLPGPPRGLMPSILSTFDVHLVTLLRLATTYTPPIQQ